MSSDQNALCSCGSGKQYKHCCITGVSKQRAEVADDIELIIAMNPNLTPEELNVAIEHKIRQQNNHPKLEFGGLSSTQMANWLYAPLHEKTAVTIAVPDDVSASPVMRYLGLILDECMQNEGSFKATSKGNLPTKLVKKASELLPEFKLAQYESEPSISEFQGSNEDKFNALHYSRVLAEIAGIMYYKSGRFHLKKAAQKQYKLHGIQTFFFPMLEVAISEYNWGYFDSFEQDVNLQHLWLFMLWRIQIHGNVNKVINEVITAFPDVLSELSPNDDFSPEQNLSILIESRFMKRFLQYWGFITVNPTKYINNKPIPIKVDIQPMLINTFQFTIQGATT